MPGLRRPVRFVQVLDRAEIDLPLNDIANFVDMETGQKVQVDPKVIRKHYRQAVQQFIDLYRKQTADRGIEYILATTEIPYDEMLRRYLTVRQKALKG